MDSTRTKVSVDKISDVYRARYGKGRVPGVTVERALGVPLSRKVFVLSDIGTAEHFGGHDPTLVCAEKAVVERLLAVVRPNAPDAEKLPRQDGEPSDYALPLSPAPGLFKRRMRRYLDQLKRKLTKRTPVDLETFVSYYKGKRRTIYDNAANSFQLNGVEKKHSYVNAFVKAEKTASNGVARVIQPRHPVYNVAVGRYLKPIEHEVYAAISRVYGWDVVMKGKNADETGEALRQEWDQLVDPVAVFLDVSRFDQHCHKEALEWEHSVYKFVYNNCKELVKLLSWQLETKGFIRLPDGTIKYYTRGQRCSGDMNTAMGNIIIMTGLIWSYFDHLERDIFPGKRVVNRGTNNGDDHTLLVEREYAQFIESDMPRWFAEMGFTLKIEGTTTVFEEIEFCRSHPIKVDGSYRMVRRLDALEKDLVSFKPIVNEKAWNVKRRAIATCGAKLTAGVPVFQAYYECLGRGAENAKVDLDPDVTGMMQLSWRMDHVAHEPDEDARVSFWLAYGIDPSHQRYLEAVWKETTCVWIPPILSPTHDVRVPFVHL